MWCSVMHLCPKFVSSVFMVWNLPKNYKPKNLINLKTFCKKPRFFPALECWTYSGTPVPFFASTFTSIGDGWIFQQRINFLRTMSVAPVSTFRMKKQWISVCVGSLSKLFQISWKVLNFCPTDKIWYCIVLDAAIHHQTKQKWPQTSEADLCASF